MNIIDIIKLYNPFKLNLEFFVLQAIEICGKSAFFISFWVAIPITLQDGFVCLN